MKNYNDFLSELKADGMPHRAAQLKASELFKAQKDDGTAPKTTAPAPKAKYSIDPDAVEAAIREAGVNIHNIPLIGRRYSPDFEFIKEKIKDGVNTRCYLDGPCRVPRTGYFKVYL